MFFLVMGVYAVQLNDLFSFIASTMRKVMLQAVAYSSAHVMEQEEARGSSISTYRIT